MNGHATAGRRSSSTPGGVARPVGQAHIVQLLVERVETPKTVWTSAPHGRARRSTERPRPRIDSALVKAIARAHRWQRLPESRECQRHRARRGRKSDRSYLCRISLLAPSIVESILDNVAENMIVQILMKDSEARRGAQHVGAVD